jgi:hypothetical protein
VPRSRKVGFRPALMNWSGLTVTVGRPDPQLGERVICEKKLNLPHHAGEVARGLNKRLNLNTQGPKAVFSQIRRFVSTSIAFAQAGAQWKVGDKVETKNNQFEWVAGRIAQRFIAGRAL